MSTRTRSTKNASSPASEPTKLELAWANQVAVLAGQKPAGIIQIRKFFMGVEFAFSWDVFSTGIKMNFGDIGYGKSGAKMGQLRRVYFNEEEIRLANEKLRLRMGSGNNREAQSCIHARFGNGKKDSRSQGHCMLGVTVSYLRETLDGEPILSLDIMYRTTELTQKFLADLKFLHEIVFPALLEGTGLQPTQVRFIFSQIYISSLYLPVLYRLVPPSTILDPMEKNDNKFWRLAASALKFLVREDNPYNYRTRAKMHEFFHQKVMPTFDDKELKKIKGHISRRHDK